MDRIEDRTERIVVKDGPLDGRVKAVCAKIESIEVDENGRVLEFRIKWSGKESRGVGTFTVDNGPPLFSPEKIHASRWGANG